MKQFALYINIILIITILASCSYPIDQEPTRFVNVKDEIEINIIKNLTESDDYILVYKTLKSDLCAESSFITDYSTSQETSSLVIDGLEIPSDCSNFNAQIIDAEDFKFTENAKVIEISLAESLVNKIYLEKFNGHISFIHNNLKGIVFDHKQLLDIKKNYLWGGIYSTSEKDIKNFNELVNSIKQVSMHRDLQNGNYGHFIVKEEIKAIHPYQFSQSDQAFALEINEENPIHETEIPNLILEFKMNHPDIDVFFVSGNGMVY